MKKKYKAIVIGLGNIGARFRHPQIKYPLNHSAAYVENHKTELIAGVDIDKEKRDFFERQFQRPAYKTMEDALFLKPEVVSICSPPHFHLEQAVACIKSGTKMIWLEKPPSVHLDEFHALQAQETKTGAKIAVNYQRRYSLNYRALRALFKSERMGKPKIIQIYYSRGLERNGCHMLDIAFFISQDQGNVELKSLTQLQGNDNPSFSFTTNGFPISVSGLNLPYHCVDILVFFDKGRATIGRLGMDSQVEIVMENELAPGFYRLTDAPQDMQLPPPGLSYMFSLEALYDLIDAYENDRQTLSNLKTAWQTQELIENIRNPTGKVL